VESFELYPHLYAGDTQIYGFCRPGDTDSLRKRVADCVAAVAHWMRSNRLQLNASKTEVLWCASARRQSQLPSDPLAVGSDLVSPVRCVHDLGIFIVADLTMRTQVCQTCSKCCYPSTTTKHTPICVKRRDAVAHRGAGVFQA